jgi:hypothetical protein
MHFYILFDVLQLLASPLNLAKSKPATLGQAEKTSSTRLTRNRTKVLEFSSRCFVLFRGSFIARVPISRVSV